MEKDKKIKNIIQVFTAVMRKAVSPEFIFPGGGMATRYVTSCIETLEKEHTGLSQERIVDYCVCQAYAIAHFPEDYMKRWKVNHSFGERALARFSGTKQSQRYYENKWLEANGLTRHFLLESIQDKSKHPLYKYVYPEYEDNTKARICGTEAGYYICGISTLLWTPLSPICKKCINAGKCKERTKKMYPELYRLREGFSKEK
ncbi:hypothetical protein OWT79_10435 [Bacteroides fragilis]|nr:hypothetical protein [Bacteroides fragilis]